MAVRLLFIHALTSIHPGTGQGVGTIDLPIARERATNLPVIPGSTLKGCIKASDKERDNDITDLAFGNSKKQGGLRISDARLLLLPVRSLGSTFVWATSPYVLRRFARDCELLETNKPPSTIPDPGEGEADVSDKTAGIEIGGKTALVLEDLSFELRQNRAPEWAKWIADRLFPNEPPWTLEFVKRFAVLNDASFDYLCEFATEVNAHISIGENGVAADGALWYEESLPAETVLVSALDVIPELKARLASLVPSRLRLGGNETTGQGLARLVLAGGSV